jgi:glycine/D-amino acid oxidase-like deaminating enzyme
VWTCQLIPELKDVIMPIREQMLAYAPISPIFSSGVAAPLITDEYWQQTPGGTILIGGCGSMAPRDDMGIWEMTPTEVVQQAIELVLPRLFPTLASELHVIQRWAGLLDFTSDMQPIVDQIPNTPHGLFVCGFSGHGMPFGMRFGQLLAEAVKSGTIPLELGPYQLNRPTLKKWEHP